MLTWEIRPGLLLRLPGNRDLEELFAVIDRNRSRLEPWLSWVYKTRSPADLTEFVREARAEYADFSISHFLIENEGRIAGGAGMKIANRSVPTGDIGYWIDAELEGRGIVTDCCKALVANAFEQLELGRLQIRCSPENRRSGAIPRRLGFTLEGVLRQCHRVDDRLLDLEYHSMLREEWLRTKARENGTTSGPGSMSHF